MAGINIPVTFTGDPASLVSGLTSAINGSAAKAADGLDKAFGRAAPGLTGALGKLRGSFAAQGRQLGTAVAAGVKTTLTVGAAATGAAVAGILGTAVTKGLSRLNAIDQASAKLRGLGQDAKGVTSIMNDATIAVTGTAFGLGDAATVAAGAIAAGVQSGTELQGVLKTVANVAAGTGTSLQEMGAIFNRVAANGKASNMELQQIQDRGLPIYQRLAEQLNVSTDAVAKLAADGKISFEQFQAAAAAAAGTVADEMGNTVAGSLDNLNAALGRIGANTLGGVFGDMAPVIQTVTAALTPLEEVTKSLGTSIGSVLGPALQSGAAALLGFMSVFSNDPSDTIDKLPKSLEGLGSVVEKAQGWGEKVKGFWDSLTGGQQAAIGIGAAVGAVAGFGSALGPLLGMLGPFGGAIGKLLPSLGSLGGLLRFAMGPLGILITLFAGAFATSEEFRGAVFGLLEALLPLGQTLISALAPILGMLPSLFGMIVTAVTPLLTVVVELAGRLLEALVPVIQSLITSLLPPLMKVFMALLPVVLSLVPVIAELASTFIDILMPVIEALLPVVSTVFEAIGPIIESVATVLQGVVQVITGIINGDFSAAWEGAKTIVSGAIDFWNSLVDGVWAIGRDLVMGLWEGITGMLGQIQAAIVGLGADIIQWFKNVLGIASPSTIFLQFGKDILQGLINGLQSLLSTVTGVITSLGQSIINGFNRAKDTVVGVFNSIVSAGRDGFTRLGSAVSSGVATVVGFVSGIPGKIKSALGNLGSLLYDSGSRIIDGLVRGIRNAIGRVTSAVGDVMAAARRLLPFSPAKEGPFSGRGWTLYSGESIIDALADGVENRSSALRAAVLASVSDASDALKGVPQMLGAPTGSRSLINTATPAVAGPPAGGMTYINNEYGPRTDSARRREFEWAGRWATNARSFDDGALGTL